MWGVYLDGGVGSESWTRGRLRIKWGGIVDWIRWI